MREQVSADTLALMALSWLLGQEEMLGGFLVASGTVPDALRDRVSDLEFLGSVLDYILTDDAWVIAFCDTQGLSYDAPMAARRALPGGGEVSWT